VDLRNILDIHVSLYLFFQRTTVEKTGLENLEQPLYLRILWFWISIRPTASNYQLYTFLLLSYACNFLSIGCDFTRWRI